MHAGREIYHLRAKYTWGGDKNSRTAGCAALECVIDGLIAVAQLPQENFDLAAYSAQMHENRCLSASCRNLVGYFLSMPRDEKGIASIQWFSYPNR